MNPKLKASIYSYLLNPLKLTGNGNLKELRMVEWSNTDLLIVVSLGRNVELSLLCLSDEILGVFKMNLPLDSGDQLDLQ